MSLCAEAQSDLEDDKRVEVVHAPADAGVPPTTRGHGSQETVEGTHWDVPGQTVVCTCWIPLASRKTITTPPGEGDDVVRGGEAPCLS